MTLILLKFLCKSCTGLLQTLHNFRRAFTTFELWFNQSISVLVKHPHCGNISKCPKLCVLLA